MLRFSRDHEQQKLGTSFLELARQAVASCIAPYQQQTLVSLRLELQPGQLVSPDIPGLVKCSRMLLKVQISHFCLMIINVSYAVIKFS